MKLFRRALRFVLRILDGRASPSNRGMKCRPLTRFDLRSRARDLTLRQTTRLFELVQLRSVIRDMSYYYSNNSAEQDPLLPEDAGAPEIHGSRPQSINYEETEVFDEDEKPQRQLLNDVWPMIFGLCIFLSLAFAFLPEDTDPNQRPEPTTIEQRVNRILTDTPLIGTYLKLHDILVLTSS